MTDEELCKALKLLAFVHNDGAMTQAADRIEQLQQALKEQSSVSDRLAEANEKLTAERDEHWKSFVHWRKEADALTEQLEAARADAKEAEAYAEELEKERDDYAFKLADANNTYSEMHVALSGANDKLAKAVEMLKILGVHPAVLAELKGDIND